MTTWEQLNVAYAINFVISFISGKFTVNLLLYLLLPKSKRTWTTCNLPKVQIRFPWSKLCQII